MIWVLLTPFCISLSLVLVLLVRQSKFLSWKFQIAVNKTFHKVTPHLVNVRSFLEILTPTYKL